MSITAFTLGLERRLNLILYLNPSWDQNWGGELQLWDRDMKGCVQQIPPLFNRAVVFDTGEGSFHGHPGALRCPIDQTRKSLAVYYLKDPRPEAIKRYRARFVVRPGDSWIPSWRSSGDSASVWLHLQMTIVPPSSLNKCPA